MAIPSKNKLLKILRPLKFRFCLQGTSITNQNSQEHIFLFVRNRRASDGHSIFFPHSTLKFCAFIRVSMHSHTSNKYHHDQCSLCLIEQHIFFVVELKKKTIFFFFFVRNIKYIKKYTFPHYNQHNEYIKACSVFWWFKMSFIVIARVQIIKWKNAVQFCELLLI